MVDLVYVAWPVIRSGFKGQITGHQAWESLLHDGALYPLVVAVIVLTVLARAGGGTLVLVIGVACLALSLGLVHVSNLEHRVLGQRQATAAQKLSQRCGLDLRTYEQDGKTYADGTVPGKGLVHYAVTVGRDGVAQLRDVIDGKPVSLPCSTVSGAST